MGGSVVGVLSVLVSHKGEFVTLGDVVARQTGSAGFASKLLRLLFVVSRVMCKIAGFSIQWGVHFTESFFTRLGDGFSICLVFDVFVVAVAVAVVVFV